MDPLLGQSSRLVRHQPGQTSENDQTEEEIEAPERLEEGHGAQADLLELATQKSLCFLGVATFEVDQLPPGRAGGLGFGGVLSWGL